MVASLRALSDHYEPPTDPPPRFDFYEMPSALRDSELKGIVGFELRVTRVDAAFKLSQNRHNADRDRIVAALQARGDEASRDIAAAMLRFGTSS